jgi:protein-L-isoaspartate(D-aspartate) O-methyltransferase
MCIKEMATMEQQNKQAASLQRGLIDQLTRQGAITTKSVEAAFRAIPRHLFLPDTLLQTVYQDTHVVSKVRGNVPISSSSQPSLMANMLELLDVQKGQRILEIGAGTGYNAALLAHLVGETGQVTTIDIDEDIVEEARRHLRVAGYERVRVVCGDGGLGYASGAPYDRIILTTAASDIAPAWFEQLAPGGLLVIPLQLTPLKSRLTIDALVTFERRDAILASRSVHVSWFIPLRGSFAFTQQNYALGPEPGLYLTTRAHVEPSALYTALLASGRDEPTGIRMLHGEVSGLHLWLALQSYDFCDIVAENAWMTRQIIPVMLQLGLPTLAVATYGLCEGETLALLRWSSETTPIWRHAVEAESPHDLYVRTFGGESHLTRQLIECVQAWDRAGRPFVMTPDWRLDRLRVHAYPQGTALPSPLPAKSCLVEKQYTRLVCEW